ncbi:matrixin family metalloprotease [Urbifossiella limnaea]|uniref:Matrixin n=1 Tax=Urbifossiella limnaea TaxID=2528023 RepID=A0A517XUW6_9BACT|nr:matrixin family metalloprotease [Urbifossiella limnaea]QDU21293.1 Matrixin [Urbifossiella limnaea]
MTDTRSRFRPRLDALEGREVPAQFGVAWGDPTHLTLSFVPDGTPAEGTPSTLFATLDAAVGRAAWQGAVLRAVQTWSELGNLNVGLVADAGQPFGTPGETQGDARFGDIRVGAVPMTAELANAVPPDPFLSGTLAGDVFLNTAGHFDPANLYGVALHEVGHALGLGPSADPRSVMYNQFSGNTVPTASDTAALRALYGVRAPDANEGDKGNAEPKTATRIHYPQSPTGAEIFSAPLVGYGDVTTRQDVDTFYLSPPGGYTGPMTVRVQTAGVSFLAARLSIVDLNNRVLAQAVGGGSAGGVLSLTLPSVNPSAKYYVRVEAAPGGPVGVGRYAVAVTMDRLQLPTVTPLDAVLRGPYDTLDANDLYAVFTDPDHAFYDDDLHADDTIDVATSLPATPGYAADSHYRVVASLADAADNDFYRVRAPDVRTAQVMTATVRAVDLNAVAPRVELLDGSNRVIPARVLVNGNGTFTVQATGVPPRKANYFVRVYEAGGASGNYALDVSFGTTAAAVSDFAAGTLAGAGAASGFNVYVGQTQLFGLTLTATGAAAAVRVQIRSAADPTGPALFDLTAAAGDTVSGPALVLPPGAYVVTFTASADATGPLGFVLSGSTLTDPVGPVAGDTTLTPQYLAPTSPTASTQPSIDTQAVYQFLYPTGRLGYDPYLWVFSF